MDVLIRNCGNKWTSRKINLWLVATKREKAMGAHSSTLAWKIPWTEEPGRLQSMGSLSRTRLSDFSFTFHLHALEKEMATHSSVLAWRIPGTGEPGGMPSLGSHRVRYDCSDLAAATATTKKGDKKTARSARALKHQAMGPDNLCRVLSNFALDRVRLEDWRLNILTRGVKGNNANVHHNSSPYVPSIASSAFSEWTRLHNPNSLEVLPLALGHSKWLWSYSS